MRWQDLYSVGTPLL